MMEYKGYIGNVEFDDSAKIFHGEIINTRDVITFQGKTVDELEAAFRDSIDDYIEWCTEEGVNPEKPTTSEDNNSSIFGMWKKHEDEKSVEEKVRNIRKGRQF